MRFETYTLLAINTTRGRLADGFIRPPRQALESAFCERSGCDERIQIEHVNAFPADRNGIPPRITGAGISRRLEFARHEHDLRH